MPFPSEITAEFRLFDRANSPPHNPRMTSPSAGLHRLTRPGLAVLCATILVSVLSTSMATVALPDLQRDFAVSDDALTWVVTGYLITFATGTVAYGRLADMYGTKRLYLFGLGIFGVASALVALAPGFWWVVAARALQGLGGTAVPSLSMATIVRTTEPGERGRPMGAMILTVGVGFGLGPLVGGSLTDLWGWEAVFWATAVSTIALFALAVFLVPAVPGRAGETFDYVGAVLLSSAVTCDLIALNRLPREPSDPVGLIGLAVSLPLWALLVWRIRAASQPYISPRVVQNARFMALAATGMGSQGAHFATVVLLPLLLARYHDLSIIQIGLVLLPGALALATAGITGGILTSRLGNRPLILAGSALMVAGTVTLHVAGVGWDPWQLSLVYVAVGGGYGLLNSPVLNAATAELAPELAGVGVGFYNLMFFLGGGICVALAGGILRAREGTAEAFSPIFNGQAPEFSDAALVVVAASLAAFLLAVALPAGKVETAHQALPAPGSPGPGGWAAKPRAKPNAER